VILASYLFRCWASFRGDDEFDEVVGEDADPSVDLPLPPSLVLDLLADDVDDLALLEAKLVVVDGVVGEQNDALFFHWKQKPKSKKEKLKQKKNTTNI